jgi:hypothetical protein
MRNLLKQVASRLRQTADTTARVGDAYRMTKLVKLGPMKSTEAWMVIRSMNGTHLSFVLMDEMGKVLKGFTTVTHEKFAAGLGKAYTLDRKFDTNGI